MDVQRFRKLLAERKIAEDEIVASISLVRRFEDFIRPAAPPQAATAQVDAFSADLMATGENTLPNYYALARYGHFIGNQDLYIAAVELLDGAEAMENLYHKTGEVLGTPRQQAIFEGLEHPPFGTPNPEKMALMRTVMNRLVEIAEAEECDRIFSHSLRDLRDAGYQDDLDLYRQCQDIEVFLDRSAQRFMVMLEKIWAEGGLFFTQPITLEVLDYLRTEPLINRGQLEGHTLYEVKIPHQTVKFLAESDPQLKRYHYCHCPWVKEGLKNGQAGIPAIFCRCSAGFHKKRWEVIFDQPLEAEIVESVLQGDPWCKIAIHLPEEAFGKQ